jgi:hypothetical protein
MGAAIGVVSTTDRTYSANALNGAGHKKNMTSHFEHQRQPPCRPGAKSP